MYVRTTLAQTSLRICADWPVHLLFVTKSVYDQGMLQQDVQDSG